MEAIPRNKDRIEIQDINEQYLSEFLEALQAAMNQMSADGIRISHVVSRGRELSKYMADVLDEDWKRMRGMEIQSVGISNISYDDQSKELINMRNKGAMLGDQSVREGYVQGSVARGLEAAGSNEGGATGAFLGMGLGMQSVEDLWKRLLLVTKDKWRSNQPNQVQQLRRIPGSAPECGNKTMVTFVQNVGLEPVSNKCSNCGYEPRGSSNFCPECGNKF